MDMRFLILSFLLMIAGCLPQSQVSKGMVANQSGDSPVTPIDTTIPQNPTQWNYLAGHYKTITIYASNLNNAYLVGYETEFFLSQNDNFKNQTYCLVADYSLAGNKKQLRAKVIPVSYYDFAAKRTVRVFRVDFNITSSEAQANCAKNLYSYNQLGELVPDTSVPASIVYAADKLCETCTARLTSTKIRLFKSEEHLLEISSQSLKLSDLGLIIDPNNGQSGGGGNGMCSISTCRSQGYDCCLDQQCVTNGAERPSARELYPEQIKIAEEELKTDPLAKMRYPHIYYICPNYVPPTPGTTTGGGGGGTTPPDYSEGLAQTKKDLACLELIKAQSPSFPFHQDLILGLPYTGNGQCLTQDADIDKTMHFKNVAKRLYSYCGCAYSDLTDMVTHCPAYYYKATTRNSAGEPTSFECQILVQDTIPIFQQVGVSARSAPHRFFNTAGSEFSSPNQSSLPQEEDVFTYLDEENNIHQQENFGINAILGPMSVTLDKALPAKQVTVELDQMYLIRTINGYFTPCPTCGKDKWHETLTAFPSSNWGNGLQAIGFSTKRDQIDGNITSGNYEDTIFGRACWVPPTMLPFTHEEMSGLDVTNQRRNRLKTQAVLYSNGYQRDWFGFNKGALIGSFDGVSWFAIGNGRLVKSTGKKLYLAINAPFADLSTPTMHNVQISLYDGQSIAAQVDYDPQFHLSHAQQNQAGNCQAHHMCQTDSDCITGLGWEYACADVSQLQTKWPTFNPHNSVENVGSQIVSIEQILAQKRFPSSNTKRCVYRGAGSICLANANAVNDLNQKKLMSCAPNFFCASLSSSSNFSGKVSRYATELENLVVNKNHLLGQDANVLGRPLHYLGEGISLPGSSRSAILSNIAANITAQPSLVAAGAGICRPGKALPNLTNQASLSNPFEQHRSADAQRRTDYISQMASCNSTLFTDYRHSSCPVLDNDGNYVQFNNSSVPGNYHLLAGKQNACGLESLSSDLTSLNSPISFLTSHSAFKDIEALPLNETTITQKTLVRDACLRRAGAVCHTDLECSPNIMHAQTAAYKPLKFFGNQAEKSYWEEYLVCGQANPKPSIYDIEATKNYDHSLNRCCREVGKDLTTVTTDTPRSTLRGDYLAHTEGLITNAHPGTIPNNPKRYSRLSSVEGLSSPERPVLTARTDRTNGGALLGMDHILKDFQWKTLREANSNTCCGGGWIRKFSDGSNDWTRKNRLHFDVSNFACLNSRHPILTIPDSLEDLYNSPADVRNLINKDYSEYCQDVTGTTGGCAQYSYVSSTSETPPLDDIFTSIEVNTVNGNFGMINSDYIFTPFSGDSHEGVTMVRNATTGSGRKNLSIRIPSYIPRVSFDAIYAQTDNGLPDPVLNPDDLVISVRTVDNETLVCSKEHGLSFPTPQDPIAACNSGCCYSFKEETRILSVALSNDALPYADKESGIYFRVDISPLNATVRRKSPGNDLYYLSRLGKLELSGIPQITYEPLYCSDNSHALVPGLFKPSLLKTRSDVESSNATHTFRNSQGLWQTTHHALVNEPVFSEDQFKCCVPLGKTTTNQGNCCSGFGVREDEESNQYTCSLPTGTNLMVYLNPFVSNEGLNLGLIENDFHEQTGEPKFSPAIVNKISQIGRNHCQNKKVRQGGAFGSYEPEPQGSRTDQSSRIYQILDSANDVGEVTNSGSTLRNGYYVFNQGYRWNHHLYCAE